ncbi:MAG: glutathione peroxidase [Bacteroidota bacterium]|nr:glutathione peroxidase [Bacteroidota bacterium]
MRLSSILIIILFPFFAMTQTSIYDITINDIDGNPINLDLFKGKYILFVNVASNCGFTSQYQKLEELHKAYIENLIIIGLPCNQFGGQEPEDEAEIKAFCQSNYGITFLMTEKIDVKGNNQHVLYQWLTNKKLNSKIDSKVKWNFQKYLIGREGTFIDFFSSFTSPKSSKITSLIR